MTFVAIPVLVLAAAASLTAITAGAAEPPKTTEQQAEKAPATKVQPHSHLQEKTGMMPEKKADKAMRQKGPDASSAPKAEGAATTQKSKDTVAKSGKLRADKDKTRHFHPRDGK